MQVNKNELLESIKILDLIVSKGSSGIGSSVYFEGNNLIASNNGMIIQIPFKTDFQCFMNPEKIIKYLEKVKDKDINISFENDNLILKNKKTELILTSYLNIKDTVKLKKIKEWKKLPLDFYKALQYCMYSSTNNEYINHSYIGYFIFNGDKVFSTNNYKLGEYTLSEKMDSFNIYTLIIISLMKIKDIIEYSVLDDIITFRTKDNIIIYCENKNIDMPEYKNILKLSDNNVEIDFIDCLVEGFDFCEILSKELNEEDKLILFEIDKDNLLISIETLEGKLKYNYKLNKEYKDKISFMLNPDLLKEIIKQKDFKCYYDKWKMFFINDNYKFVCKVAVE